MAQDPHGTSTMNSQIDFADLKSRFFNQLCPCGNSDRSHFSYIEEDGEILMRECTECHDIIGLDDSIYDEVGWVTRKTFACRCATAEMKTHLPLYLTKSATTLC